MTAQLPENLTSLKSCLYEEDYCLWIETTINQLDNGKLAEVDLINLIEELANLVKSEKRALESNLEVILMHLLKYQYQPKKRSNSWRYTILEHRDRVERIIEDSPSLKSYLYQIFDRCYSKARKKASVKTGLSIETFPSEFLFTIEETLNSDYLPQ